jgi:Icc-related predicted phosphoesterase
MKTWLISDTHNHHDQLQIPANVEMVIHCGDEANSHKSKPNLQESRDFFQWFNSLTIARKIFVPGNHSVAIEHGLLQPSDYPQVHFLIHQQIDIEGIKIFGSPYTPWFFNWAYNVVRPDLDAIWATIPSGIDLLITHGPPKGILDITRDWKSKQPIHVGSLSLTRHVTGRIKPKVHAFGHIHDENGIRNFGVVEKDQVLFVNCSCCDLPGQLVNHGVVMELGEVYKVLSD